MKRKYSDLVSTRSIARAHYLTQKDLLRRKKIAEPQRSYPNRVLDFLKTNIWGWLYHYIKSRFGARHPFATYPSTGSNGIYTMSPDDSGTVRISLAADWATGTDESQRIAHLMDQFKPHYT